MDTLTYNLLLRDALIIKLKETKEGQDYLEDCWRLSQEEPDIDAIARFNSRQDN